MFLQRILIGLLVSGVGVAVVLKTNTFIDIAGPLPWIERQFGYGGTKFVYKLAGILIILVGFLEITNLFDLVIGGFISRIF